MMGLSFQIVTHSWFFFYLSYFKLRKRCQYQFTATVLVFRDFVVLFQDYKAYKANDHEEN